MATLSRTQPVHKTKLWCTFNFTMDDVVWVKNGRIWERWKIIED